MHPPAVAAPAADCGRFEWHSYTSGAQGRRYKLYVPGGNDAARPAPLVVMLHGCTQDPDDLARGTRMNELAQRERALVVYPEQPATANALRCWRWFEPAQQRRDGEEPAIIAGIVREVMRTHTIDARRVHVAGISAGGAMALIVAAAYPELFASATSHSGVPVGVVASAEEGWAIMRAGVPDSLDLAARLRGVAGATARAVPLLVIHGAADNVVSVRNARQTAQQWSTAFGLAPRATPSAAPDAAAPYEVAEWGAPNGPAVVRLAVMPALGHAWSGGSKAGTFTDEHGPSAAEMAMAFFAEHPMPQERRAP
jgi:poly(hydroxyalkanoate) depolymerase family esterase